MIKIGFTGTRQGMTDRQRMVIEEILRNAVNQDEGVEFHHGDCVGSDEQAAKIAKAEDCTVVGHPPEDDKCRSFFESHEVWDEKRFMDRNEDILMASDVMIATPGEDTEQLRSGTWATIRRTKGEEKPLIIIFPEGDDETHYGSNLGDISMDELL